MWQSSIEEADVARGAWMRGRGWETATGSGGYGEDLGFY